MNDDPKGSVLLVSNDVLYRSGINTILTHAGYVVFEAGNGITGVHVYKELIPDLVFVDMDSLGEERLAFLEAINTLNSKAKCITVHDKGVLERTDLTLRDPHKIFIKTRPDRMFGCNFEVIFSRVFLYAGDLDYEIESEDFGKYANQDNEMTKRVLM